MKEFLAFVAENTVVVINAVALVIIVLGTIEAFLRSICAILRRSMTGHELRSAYLRYGRRLVAGLTFQIAADVVETSIAPTWEEIGRLSAIVAIRTFLNFFLERDLAEVQRREAESLRIP